jgi:hypothetical protein
MYDVEFTACPRWCKPVTHRCGLARGYRCCFIPFCCHVREIA